MLRKFAAVLIAATMFTAPVLAQGTGPAAPSQTSQPAQAPVVKSAKIKTVKIKTHRVHKHKVVKHIKKHRRHVRHVKPAKPHKKVVTTTAAPSTAKSAPTRSN